MTYLVTTALDSVKVVDMTVHFSQLLVKMEVAVTVDSKSSVVVATIPEDGTSTSVMRNTSEVTEMVVVGSLDDG